METKILTAKEIFENLKQNKTSVDDAYLDAFYDNCLVQAKKFMEANQVKALRRISFLMDCVTKERELVKNGVNTFIYRDDITDFLERREIRESGIKLIELEQYTRIIPDEIIETMKCIKPYVDNFYVLFTDYSGKAEKEAIRDRKIAKKEKDPILFATFQVTVEQTPQMRNNPNADISKINDRFYVVGDWEDEFCDLTLDKFLSMTKPENLKEIITPKTRDEIAMELERFDENLKIRNDSFRIKKPSKFGFFRKIRSFLKYE
jgi:hypothetical protein